MRLGVVLAILLMASFTFLPATPAVAHADLLKAEFQGASSAGKPPQMLVFHFSEAIDPTFSQVRILDGQDRVIDPGPGTASPTDSRQLSIEIGRLPSGNYIADLRIRSVDDGHVTQTALPFSIGLGINTIGGLPPLGTADPALQPPPVLESIARWLGLLGAALAAGSVLFGFLVRRTAGTEFTAGSLPMVFVGTGLMVVGAFLVLLVEAAGAAGVPLGQAFGAPLADVLMRRSGELLLVRMGFALLLAVVAWIAARPKAVATTLRRFLFASFDLLLMAGILLTFSLSGHAAASSQAVVSTGLDWVHLLAMVAWLGGLVPLALALRRASQPALPGGPAIADYRPLVGRFSRLALVCVAILLVTGLYAFLLDVRHIALLPQTTYGRVLLVKLGLVAALVGLGALNRLLVLPGMRTSGHEVADRATRHFRWSLRAELAAGALLLGAVGIMTTLAPSASVWAEHQRLEPMRASSVGSVQLVIRVTPGRTGSNSIAIDVADPRTGAATVEGRVTLKVVGSQSEGSTLASERQGRTLERYLFLDLPLAAPGLVRFDVTLSRPGFAIVNHVFGLRIGQTALE